MKRSTTVSTAGSSGSTVDTNVVASDVSCSPDAGTLSVANYSHICFHQIIRVLAWNLKKRLVDPFILSSYGKN